MWLFFFFSVTESRVNLQLIFQKANIHFVDVNDEPIKLFLFIIIIFHSTEKRKQQLKITIIICKCVRIFVLNYPCKFCTGTTNWSVFIRIMNPHTKVWPLITICNLLRVWARCFVKCRTFTVIQINQTCRCQNSNIHLYTSITFDYLIFKTFFFHQCTRSTSLFSSCVLITHFMQSRKVFAVVFFGF